MKQLLIRPSGALRGSVQIGGSKNAALPILAAALLADGPCVIGNLPAIRDVELTLQILLHMGCTVEWIDRATCKIDARHASPSATPDPLTGRLRASTYFLGAGLGRFGEGRIGRIGGCDFGTRPIDQHVKAFRALGATVERLDGEVYVYAKRPLQGARIVFDTVSVGATVNAILAAVRANGETVLCRAAREPHVVDLACFLNRLGADIRGAGTDEIRIQGVHHLSGATHSVVPDMIEAGTYLLAGAATRGAVRVIGVQPRDLAPLSCSLRAMGADVDEEDDSLSVFASTALRSTCVETGPHPAFPTDLQPQMTALLATAKGVGVVRETVWQNRFRYVDELQKMQAAITRRGNALTVLGGRLYGADVTVPDLRAGAALLIAACAAEGNSTLREAHWIERGYENLLSKMQSLGADITACEE
ncbi:MAG: UDP-N-acetylglucosamine 1-carboxyvinyltransferase [Clostridia bacterium]|nr:UDP-N-acetylglucosamine 1-carboxyvinyltransferase [Clostridia bacterium]